ncbi:MAG TPA: iron ABC transporter permease [Bacilli bacterium]
MKQTASHWGKKLAVWLPIISLLVLLIDLVSIFIGSAQLSFALVWDTIVSRIPVLRHVAALSPGQAVETIIWEIRIPRVLLGMLCGAALSAAGTAFQGILRNPLADPYILGVSSGSSLGAAFVILFGLQTSVLGQWTLPLAAFATGIITLLVVLALAQSGRGIRVETLILAGVVVQAFIAALLSFILSVSDWKMQMIMLWMMGSLTAADWGYVEIVLPYIVICVFIIWMYTQKLNVLALGEESAYHLGVSVNRTRVVVLVTASLLTAAAVSVSGTIGFVGLIIPHLVRLVFGADHRVVLPISVVLGAGFLVLADTLARTLLEPRELPIGIFTALLGAPFFGYLLRQVRRQFFS